MKPLVVIPARGGSKGIPRKNIKPLGGRPLIQWTIDEARKIFPDEIIYVSTDDLEIKNVAEECGLKVPFLRPIELASDTAGTYEVLLHAVQFYEENGYYPDVLILLQPTSPFRTSNHIEDAMTLFSRNIDMVVSVKETNANPYYVLMEENQDGFLIKSKQSNSIRRQDTPKVWEINGAIYIINVNTLKEKPLNQFSKVKKYVMNEVSSHDIDVELDWLVAETIYNKYYR